MDPVLFRTDSGNNYIYSPAKKSVLPLPLDVYEDILENGYSRSVIYLNLEQYGYLDSWHDDFNGIVYEDDIKNSLQNLSQIVFETTTACNLRCRYCCYGEGYNTFASRHWKHGNLRFSIAKAVLDFLTYTFNTSSYTQAIEEPFAISFYGGEPLMNFTVIKDIVDYAETLNFRNRKLSFTMTTNATLLSRYAEFLCRHNFKLLVSLDGDKNHNIHRKDSHDKESFDVVIENLNKVRALYPEWFSTFRYNSVFTNASDVNEIVKWFRKKFGKVPNFSPLNDQTVGSSDYALITSLINKFEIPEDLRLQEDLMSQSPMLKRILEFSYHLFSNVYANESFFLKEESERYPTGTCIPFSKRMFVTFDGELHPCEKVNRDNPLGIIVNDEVIIDHSQIAKNFNQQTRELKLTCQNCYLQQCCTKCMLCFDKGRCDSFTNKERFTELLSQSFSYIEKHPNLLTVLEDNIITK